MIFWIGNRDRRHGRAHQSLSRLVLRCNSIGVAKATSRFASTQRHPKYVIPSEAQRSRGTPAFRPQCHNSVIPSEAQRSGEPALSEVEWEPASPPTPRPSQKSGAPYLEEMWVRRMPDNAEAAVPHSWPRSGHEWGLRAKLEPPCLRARLQPCRRSQAVERGFSR